MSNVVSLLRSDYCPECQRIGCCGGEQDCRAYREHVAAALDRGLERAFKRMAPDETEPEHAQ